MTTYVPQTWIDGPSGATPLSAARMNYIEAGILAASSGAGGLLAANNLSDLASASTARTNLGLGTAATSASSAFLQTANNLSDVTAATARTNLGLGTAATQATGTFLQTANNLSDVIAATARTNLGLGAIATLTSTASTDLSGTWPSITVAKVQGVAITSGQAAILSQATAAATRSATATVSAGEETIFTGSTAAQTLTLPTTPQQNTINTVTNIASVSVTLAAGGSDTINKSTNVGSLTVTQFLYVQLVYIGTVWYVMSYGYLNGPTGAAGGDLSGSYPSPTVAKINGTALSGLATGILKNTTTTGVPSIAVAADIPTVAQGSTGPLSATDASTTNARVPSGSTGGDLTGTYPSTITVAKVQGVAVTATNATLLANNSNASVRSATATVGQSESTIFSGSTAAQTLTLPASPSNNTINTFANISSVSVTIAPGASNTINNNGTVGSITLPVGGSVQMTYIATVWYVLDYGLLAGPTGTASGDLSGTYPAPTVAKINGTALSGLATGILKNTTATGVPSIAVAADIPTAAIGSTGPMSATTVLSAITAPTAAVNLNSQKITSLANGTAASDGAAFGQIPTAGSAIPTETIGGSAGSATTYMRSDAHPTRGYWIASDYGFAMMTYPPELLAVTGTAFSSGTVYVSEMFLDAIATVTTLWLSVGTAGSGFTASQSGVALYDGTKTLIGSTFTNSASTALSTAFTSTGIVQSTLTPTGTGLTSLAAGRYYAAIFQVATTPAVLRASANTSMVNGALSSTNAKYASADTGRTTSFPTTLGAFTGISGANFFAVN